MSIRGRSNEFDWQTREHLQENISPMGTEEGMIWRMWKCEGYTTHSSKSARRLHIDGYLLETLTLHDHVSKPQQAARPVVPS